MTQKRAFTLIEVLTVLAIMGILSSMLFPSLARAREGGRRSSCSSNLRQIGLATALYVEDNDERYLLMENKMPVKAELPVPEGCPTVKQVSVAWPYALRPYTKSDAIFICPSVAQPAESPVDSTPTKLLWDHCTPLPGGGGGGGGGPDPSCPPFPKVPVPQPTYAFNTMAHLEEYWIHTEAIEIGQGFAQAHVVVNKCSVPPSAPGTTSGHLSHALGVHVAAVIEPSETIMVTDAETKDGKAPDTVNFTNDQELDYPLKPSTEVVDVPSAHVFLAKRHLGGYNALFADGHTKFMPYGTSHPRQWSVEQD